MADGSTKEIKDVKVGQKVLASDPTTGASKPETVTALHADHDTNPTDLTLRIDGNRTTVVHTTSQHLFWDATIDHWTAAATLRDGDHLYTTDGDVVTVAQVRTWIGGLDTRNLTVANLHTYYVIAGNVPVLVHNCDIGESIAQHITGRRTLNGVEPGSETAYIEGLIHNPGPLVRWFALESSTRTRASRSGWMRQPATS